MDRVKLEFGRQKPCPKCKGWGSIRYKGPFYRKSHAKDSKTCPKCEGRGYI